MTAELDPRWEWISIGTIDDPYQMVKGRCLHRTPVPVHAQPTGELVAQLCPDCDTQLPADWDPDAYPVIRLRNSLTG